jgi:hypothetical protein
MDEVAVERSTGGGMAWEQAALMERRVPDA